jgi:hypothetical protein
MKLQWHKLLFKLTVWLFAEITLNLLGLDDLADYGDFIFDHKRNLALSNTYIACVVTEERTKNLGIRVNNSQEKSI